MPKITLPYDFEKLLNRLESMSDEEIMHEYTEVSNVRISLMQNPDENYVYTYIEPIDQAHDLLGHYLARKLCTENGFKFTF